MHIFIKINTVASLIIRLLAAIASQHWFNLTSVMSTLHEEIEQKSKEIITDNYSMSVGEIISMYREGDLDIHPEFQRFFRWTDSQKSRLIESFLLNFPVPPIFVYQRTDGVWDIVDGLQRVSTILQFVGIYKKRRWSANGSPNPWRHRTITKHGR